MIRLNKGPCCVYCFILGLYCNFFPKCCYQFLHYGIVRKIIPLTEVWRGGRWCNVLFRIIGTKLQLRLTWGFVEVSLFLGCGATSIIGSVFATGCPAVRVDWNLNCDWLSNGQWEKTWKRLAKNQIIGTLLNQ